MEKLLLLFIRAIFLPVLLDFSTEELRLVVKLSPDRLFVRQIIRDTLPSRLHLEFNLNWFDDIESLVDFHHENYL